MAMAMSACSGLPKIVWVVRMSKACGMRGCGKRPLLQHPRQVGLLDLAMENDVHGEHWQHGDHRGGGEAGVKGGIAPDEERQAQWDGAHVGVLHHYQADQVLVPAPEAVSYTHL